MGWTAGRFWGWVELLPEGTEMDEDPGFLLYLDMQVLMFLLWEEEMVKYEL